MDNGYLGEIRLFAANFAPQNWAFCRGQLLAINSNQALFSLLGTFYGGNGSTNFALPNLQGRALVGTGTGSGLTSYVIGETAGSYLEFEGMLCPSPQLIGSSYNRRVRRLCKKCR